MNKIIRKIVGIFDIPTADRLLVFWVVGIGRLYLGLPITLYITHVKVGMWLHAKWLSYWAFWFFHYLERDTGWPQTQELMRRNPLCPAGVWYQYKKMLFEWTPEEIGGFLVCESDRNTYRERQLRCGFVPQI